MIADILLDFVIFLIQRLLLPVLPNSIDFYPIEVFSANLYAVKSNLITSFSGLGQLFPINLILIIFSVIIFSEIILFSFKIGVFLINIVRGSGA